MSSSFRLVLAVTSPTALLDVQRTPSLIRAIRGLQDFWPSLPLTVVTHSTHSRAVFELLGKIHISHEFHLCDPCDPQALAAVLEPESRSCDAFILHDASRPLTSAAQFSRILEAFSDSVDAVRPSIAFTETLKIISSGSLIQKTLDRSTVRRISTPEIIRTSVIDFQSEVLGWLLPLKKDARIKHVEGSPESLRINSEPDRDLLESFLHWRQGRA